jgi:hypothetical protein
MDMSARKFDTLSEEKELNDQLGVISQNENICISELEIDTIRLLNNAQDENTASISEYKKEISKILSTLLDYSTRKGILIRRKNICQQYLYRL